MREQSPAARTGAMHGVARDLRRQETPAEKYLWSLLRGGQLGRRFRRQRVIESFVVDFCCPSDRLVVEVDGSVHDSPEAQADDEWRTGRPREPGFRVLRVSNDEVLRHPDVELSRIRSVLDPIRSR